MDLLDDEVVLLWKALNNHHVEYILVGGFATNLHGYSRYTADLDIWLHDTPVNRKNLRKAIDEIGLGDLNEIETMQFVPGWSSIILESGFTVDLMAYIKGFPQERFEDCYKIASTAMIHDVEVRFLHKRHLLESKQATARPKDLLDIEELNKLD